MRRTHRSNFALAVVGAMVCVSSAHGAALIAPNAAANAYGTEARGTVFWGFGRTLQLQLAASQLDEIPVGSAINGLAFRLARSQNHRFSPNFSDWRVTLAQAAHPIADMSSTFADNMINPVLVRSGPLSIPDNSYPSGFSLTPPNFGPLIPFGTPYQYMGGDLVIHVTHTGISQAGTIGSTVGELDATAGSGFGSLFRALWADGFDAATSSMQDAFTITQISFDPVPEPGAMEVCAGVLVSAVSVCRKQARGRRRLLPW